MAASVNFLVVARISDGLILTSRFEGKITSQQRRAFDAAFKNMLQNAGKISYPGWREKVPVTCDGATSSSTLFGFLDHQAICLLACGTLGNYPDRIAHELLAEFSTNVRNVVGDQCISEAGSELTQLRDPVRNLFRKYNDLAKMDKAIAVQEKVDSLKVVMQDNVRKILETHASLEHLEDSSRSMSESAGKFLKQSTDLKRQLQLRNLKVKAIVGVCGLAFATYLTYPVLNAFG